MSREKGDAGSALIFAMGIVLIVLMLAGVVTSRVVSHAHHVRHFEDFNDGLLGLESAFSLSYAELNTGLDGLLGVDSWDPRQGIPEITSPGVTPVLLGDSLTEILAYVSRWDSDGIDNLGDGLVDLGPETDIVSIHASARCGDTTRRAIRLLSRAERRTVWDHALFGGPGDRSKQDSIVTLKTGKVKLRLHGPVHLLGNDLLEGDDAIRLTNGSYIRNSYEGVPKSILPLLPPIPVVGNDESLEATLRVGQGSVNVSKRTFIGQPAKARDGNKELLDGTFVDDGWTGALQDGAPRNYFSENHSDTPYNPAFAIPFPRFDDDEGEDFLKYYLEDFGSGHAGSHAIHQGTITLKRNQNYYWNANENIESKGEKLGQGNMPGYAEVAKLLDHAENFIWWDAKSNQMVINGQVAIDGDFETDRAQVNYHGKGTILAADIDGVGGGGNVILRGSLVPTTVNFRTGAAVPGNYPDGNLLGLMAGSSMTTQRSANRLFALLYAEDVMRIGRATSVAGSIVANRVEIDATTRLIHVPGIGNALDERMKMIGARSDAFAGLVPIAWSELGVE